MAKSSALFCLVALLLVTSASCQEVEMEMEEEAEPKFEGMAIEDPLMEEDPAGTLMPFLELKGEITVLSSTGFAPQMMHYVVGNALRVSFFVQRNVDINLADSNAEGSYELTISEGKRESKNFDYSGAPIADSGALVFSIPKGSFSLPKANQVLSGARRSMNSIQFEFFATDDALEASEGVEVSTQEEEGDITGGEDEPLDSEPAEGSEMLDGDEVSEDGELEEENFDEADMIDVSTEAVDETEQLEEGDEDEPVLEEETDVEDANDTLQLPTDEDPPADVGEEEAEEGDSQAEEPQEQEAQEQEAQASDEEWGEEEEGPEGYGQEGDQQQEQEQAPEVEQEQPELEQEDYPAFEEGDFEEPRDEL